MTDLSYWMKKIQDKRKKTPRRDFLMEICSWKPFVLSKQWWIISRFSTQERNTSVPTQEFIDQRDSLLEYWIDYTGHFRDNMKQLFLTCPLPWLLSFFQNENSDYADIVIWSKNCYLSYAVVQSENVYYSETIKDKCRNVYNSIMVIEKCENIYSSASIFRSYNIFFSRLIINSSSIRESSHLVNCHECIRCNDLENQSYCIDNKTYSQSEYEQYKKEYFNHTLPSIVSVPPYTWTKHTSIASRDITWSYIINSSHIESWYFVFSTEHARNVVLGWAAQGNTHFYDIFGCGSPKADHFYGVMWWWSYAENIYCCSHINWWSSNFYSYFLENCSFCLGCIWLQNKQFCIFNKQYTKEARYKKVDEIFLRMDQEWTLGQFFPGLMNPFYFNDTAAYLIDPSFTKEEVTAKWYLRRNEPITVDIPEWVQTVSTHDLWQFETIENGKPTISNEILRKVIIDKSWNAYRIIPMELDFLNKHWLPLPRLHRLERLKQHFTMS